MSGAQLKNSLRQMLAVLETERQALAGLDLDAIIGATRDKAHVCTALNGVAPVTLDEECRSMLEAARRLNDVNRQVRNLVAANVSRRLDALAGSPRGRRPSLRLAYAANSA